MSPTSRVPARDARVQIVTAGPDEPAAAIGDRHAGKGLHYAIVTDPDGRLLGTVHAADLASDRPERRANRR